MFQVVSAAMYASLKPSQPTFDVCEDGER